MSDIKSLERAATRAITIMNLHQLRGQVDGSVVQTRKMYLSVEAARRATGKLNRAIESNRYQEACARRRFA